MIVLQTTRQSHDALDSRLLIRQVHARLLLCLLTSCLARRSRLQLPRHALEIVGHLGIRLQEE